MWINSHNRQKYNRRMCIHPAPFTYDIMMTELFQTLENFDIANMIIGGDFNARTGQLTASPWHLNPDLSQHRHSRDDHVCKRGKLLINGIRNGGLSLLNGHCKSDNHGEYTQTERGMSVIDYIMSGPLATTSVLDFEVGEISRSDHQPCTVSMYIEGANQTQQNFKVSTTTTEKIKWNPEYAAIFQSALETIPVQQSNSIEQQYEHNKSSILAAAKEAHMVESHRQKINISNSQPWFDRECRTANWNVNVALRTCKKQGFTEENTRIYLQYKSDAKTIHSLKKEKYYSDLQEQISNTQNSSCFWKTVKQLNHKRQEACPITKQEWESFYENVMPQQRPPQHKYYGTFWEIYDTEPTLAELTNAIKSLKTGKSPGCDGITNELLKSFPENWKHEILRFIQQIFRSESVPSSLTDITVTMLHKKGPRQDPRNYRGISLINTILKLYTTILLKRIQDWADTYNILPESQAGFCKHRGCIDHIFTLNSLRQISLMKRRNRKLHLLFVDFARAFDSIDHEKLWAKLYKLGLSAKIIRVLSDIYGKASMNIRTVSGNTRKFPVSAGVLQGELTSPLLFALYISDIDDVFKALEYEGVRGISVNSSTSIHILCYADDMVIMAENAIHLQRKLDALHIYCKDHGLTVNVDKTKILVVNNSHPRNNYNVTFSYEGNTLQVVREFTYLGVTFCECGRFHKHFDSLATKVASAAASITSVILRSRTSSWDAVTKLYNAMLLSIPYYGCEIFGPESEDEMERIQQNFLKRLMHLPRYTPGYMLRTETGTNHTAAAVLKRSMRLFDKLSNMDTHRYPHICLMELLKLHKKTPNIKSNWVSTLLDKLANNGLVVYDLPLRVYSQNMEMGLEGIEKHVAAE